MIISKIKFSFYCCFYVVYLIDSGIVSVLEIMVVIGMFWCIVQDIIVVLEELDIVCEFEQWEGVCNYQGGYVICDWGVVWWEWVVEQYW